MARLPMAVLFRLQNFFVTIGGMHAIEIATRLIVGPGDEALIPTPAWPNFVGALEISGARAVPVPLDKEGRWSLDPSKLEKAITPATKLIFFNTPANPTGFVATREEIVETLAIARRHGLWIIADEIYGRLTYDGRRAPSFHDVMAPDDKILFVQTLSKNWAMTGFRIGWLEAPPELGYVIENLVQYTTSGVPVFNQRAATAALEQGETFLAWQIERCRRSRDILCEGLAKTGRVRFFKPEAAFYLFFSIDGFSDSRALALQLIDEAGVGAAPGGAFGPGGEGHLRDLLRPRSRTDRGSDAPHGAVARGLEQVVFGLRRPRANGSDDRTISGGKSEIAVSLPHEESRLFRRPRPRLSDPDSSHRGKSALKKLLTLLSV